MKRLLFASLGILFFVIGFIGVFLPLLPTTPFMLLALWAFSQSSQRLHDYIWNHPWFGQAIRDWKQHGVVSRGAKLSAIILVSISFIILIFFSPVPLWAILPFLIVFVVSVFWLWKRPERPPV